MKAPLSSLRILNTQAPIKDLERLWLECACAYECFDENLMEDAEWDALGRELWARREELSPYFCRATGLDYPHPDAEPGENPLKTASGIDWDDQLKLGCVVREGQNTPRNMQERVRRWQARLVDLYDYRGQWHLPEVCRMRRP